MHALGGFAFAPLSAKLASLPPIRTETMGKIHVLSENVANKIAAGEVVERPASVVKEMLENSLDAAATRIKISIEAGGKKLIQITDNGCGMVRDDAMLAFERHATSKIKDADDLLSVSTLGFRGEALPSIASVSRLRLETRAVEEPSGTVIEINGGKFGRVEEAGLPLGTSITVRASLLVPSGAGPLPAPLDSASPTAASALLSVTSFDGAG